MNGEPQEGSTEREFTRILRERRLRTVFQPVVRLESGATVGYEALVRGPQGSDLRSAPALLAAAYRANRVAEFDWIARASACRAAMAAELSAEQLLFINIEPLSFDSDCPPDLWPDIEKAFDMFQVVLEVTERSLDRDPGTLLDGLDSLRQAVAGFALDDVGTNTATLSMLPLVAPAVIKLDLAVTQGGPTADVAGVLDVVFEEAERTGATILAEGIETAAHADFARSLGATLGQGHYFGKAVPLAEHGHRITQPVHLRADTASVVATPFDALDGRITGRSPADLLTALSTHIQSGTIDVPGATLHITHLPNTTMYGPVDQHRLGVLAQQGVMTALLGPGIPAEPGGGVRGIGQHHDLPFDGQWTVLTLSPASAAAMVARAADSSETEFDFAVVHDKQRVIAVARCLFRRLGATGSHFSR